MSNFLDYLDWRGDLSFDRDPFNEVDNLIFSEIAYADLRGIVPAPGEEGASRCARRPSAMRARDGTSPIWSTIPKSCCAARDRASVSARCA